MFGKKSGKQSHHNSEKDKINKPNQGGERPLQ
jgi:hypothetical protein